MNTVQYITYMNIINLSLTDACNKGSNDFYQLNGYLGSATKKEIPHN